MLSSSTYLKGVVSALITFGVFGALLLFFKDDEGGRSFFLLSCVTTSFYAYYRRNEHGKNEIYRGILFGLAALFLVILVTSTIKAIVSKAEWDFLCFYMQGLLGAYKLDFYDPHSFQTILSRIQFNHTFSDSFKAEILDVGLLSPPVTMLFFAPLTSFNYETSKAIFSVLIFVFIIWDVAIANRLFFKKERTIDSLLFTFIILALLPGTFETVFYNQTNFFLLFFILQTIKNINKPTAGIYLALSIVIKPITGILLLFFIIHRRWKAAMAFVVTGCLLVAITGMIWGIHNVTGFFTSPPTSRLPHSLYEQPLNQSIIALFNRNIKFSGVTQYMIDLLYYCTVAIIIVVTIIVSKKLSKRGSLVSFFPFMLCMLMIYPSSLNHYMVCILPICLYLLSLKGENLFFWISLAAGFSFLNTEAFLSYAVFFVILCWLAWSYPEGRTSDSKPKFSMKFRETSSLFS